MVLDILKSFFTRSRPRGSDALPEPDGKLECLPARSIPTLERIGSFFFPAFWDIEDQESFSQSVRQLTASMPPGYHASDNFITWGRNNSMFDDQAFVNAWQGNCESAADKGIVWRRYILATSAFHCVQLEGDFVECGAYTGVGVKTVVDYLGGTRFPKTFWAYDVFEHQDHMDNVPMPEVGPELFSRVEKKFQNYPQVRLVKGLIPDSFKDHCPERIAYLHIDLNQAKAEVAALDVLFSRVVSGGMVILDDYEWASIYRPQKIAEDAWFDQRGYRVIPLPTGQGLLIKR